MLGFCYCGSAFCSCQRCPRGDLKIICRFHMLWPACDWEVVAGARILYVLANEADDDRPALDLLWHYVFLQLRSARPSPAVAAGGHVVSSLHPVLEYHGFHAIRLPEDIPHLFSAGPIEAPASFNFLRKAYLGGLEPLTRW